MKILLSFAFVLVFSLAGFGQKSDIDSIDETGWTALMYSAQSLAPDEIGKMLKKKPNLEIKDRYGWTALMYAVASQDVSKINTLLNATADVNTSDNRGWTPLMIAAMGEKDEIVKSLLAKGANVNAKNKKGATALSFAYGKGRKNNSLLLIAAGGAGVELNQSEVPEKLVPVDQPPQALNIRDGFARYTEAARQNVVTGTVYLRLLIGTDGRVKKTKVIKGLPYGLTEQSVEAAAKVKYYPAIYEGKVIEYWISTTRNFSIY